MRKLRSVSSKNKIDIKAVGIILVVDADVQKGFEERWLFAVFIKDGYQAAVGDARFLLGTHLLLNLFRQPCLPFIAHPLGVDALRRENEDKNAGAGKALFKFGRYAVTGKNLPFVQLIPSWLT